MKDRGQRSDEPLATSLRSTVTDAGPGASSSSPNANSTPSSAASASGSERWSCLRYADPSEATQPVNAATATPIADNLPSLRVMRIAKCFQPRAASPAAITTMRYARSEWGKARGESGIARSPARAGETYSPALAAGTLCPPGSAAKFARFVIASPPGLRTPPSPPGRGRKGNTH